MDGVSTALEDKALDETTETSSYLSKGQSWMRERNTAVAMTMFNFLLSSSAGDFSSKPIQE